MKPLSAEKILDDGDSSDIKKELERESENLKQIADSADKIDIPESKIPDGDEVDQVRGESLGKGIERSKKPQTFSFLPHPYLQRLWLPDPVPDEKAPRTDFATDENAEVSEDVMGLQKIRRDSAVLRSFAHPLHPSLFFIPLKPLLTVVNRLSDQIITEIFQNVDEELQMAKEYPHLFIVLDDVTRTNFTKVVSYLNTQRTLVFVLDRFLSLLGPRPQDQSDSTGGSIRQSQSDFNMVSQTQVGGVRFDQPKLGSSELSQSQPSNPCATGQSRDPACLLIASRHFIFLFDLLHIPMSIFRPMLEDAGVHKIVYDFDQDYQFLRSKHEIKTKNFYDVVEAEKNLEKKFGLNSLRSYSMRQFRQRYRKNCFSFGNFPPEDFFPTRLENPAGNFFLPKKIRNLPDSILHGILKQGVYLDLIKRCQMSLFLRASVKLTEMRLACLYLLDEGVADPSQENDFGNEKIRRKNFVEDEIEDEIDDY